MFGGANTPTSIREEAAPRSSNARPLRTWGLAVWHAPLEPLGGRHWLGPQSLTRFVCINIGRQSEEGTT